MVQNSRELRIKQKNFCNEIKTNKILKNQIIKRKEEGIYTSRKEGHLQKKRIYGKEKNYICLSSVNEMNAVIAFVNNKLEIK